MKTDGVLVTLIDFTLSRLITSDGDTAFSDLSADPDLFKGPKGDCQASPIAVSPKFMCEWWREGPSSLTSLLQRLPEDLAATLITYPCIARDRQETEFCTSYLSRGSYR